MLQCISNDYIVDIATLTALVKFYSFRSFWGTGRGEIFYLAHFYYNYVIKRHALIHNDNSVIIIKFYHLFFDTLPEYSPLVCYYGNSI